MTSDRRTPSLAGAGIAYAYAEGAGRERGAGGALAWGQISNGHIPETVRDNPINMVL